MKTFAEHLHELKNRFFICLAFMGIGSLIGFLTHKKIELFLQKPLNQTLYYSDPAGGLSFVMQIALMVGAMLAMPMLMFQLVQFLRPAMKPLKTRMILACISCSLLLIVLAVVYAYTISMPAALHFLTNFNSENVKALISVSDYVRFLFAYILGTVAAFQIPLILFFMNKIKRFPPGSLLKLQRPAIIGAIIFSGVITPTVDPMNQMMVAVPIISLFELGSIAVFISNRKHKPVPKFEIKMPAQFIPITVPMDEPVAEVIPVNRPVTTPSPAPVFRDIQPILQPVRAASRHSVRPRPIMDVFAPAHA